MKKFYLLYFCIIWLYPTIAQTVTDVDGNVYNTVTIGTQVWLKENLKTSKYNDGTSIPKITDNTVWDNATTAAYCWYNNDSATNAATNGALYNWFVIDLANNGNKNVCPSGWYVSSDAEWDTLVSFLTNNGYGYEGSGNDIAKSIAASSGWTSYGTAGRPGNDQASNNSSGFTAVPSGYRINGNFNEIKSYGFWWVPNGYGAIEAWYRFLGLDYPYLDHYHRTKTWGLSIRCIKDLTVSANEISLNNLDIYPNPVTNIINVTNNIKVGTITIYNLAGVKILQQQIRESNSIDISALSPGVYIIRLSSPSGMQQQKLIKK